jgi:hypothetical protein
LSAVAAETRAVAPTVVPVTGARITCGSLWFAAGAGYEGGEYALAVANAWQALARQRRLDVEVVAGWDAVVVTFRAPADAAESADATLAGLRDPGEALLADAAWRARVEAASALADDDAALARLLAALAGRSDVAAWAETAAALPRALTPADIAAACARSLRTLRHVLLVGAAARAAVAPLIVPLEPLRRRAEPQAAETRWGCLGDESDGAVTLTVLIETTPAESASILIAEAIVERSLFASLRERLGLVYGIVSTRRVGALVVDLRIPARGLESAIAAVEDAVRPTREEAESGRAAAHARFALARETTLGTLELLLSVADRNGGIPALHDLETALRTRRTPKLAVAAVAVSGAADALAPRRPWRNGS